MKLLRKAEPLRGGYNAIVRPGEFGLRYLEFGRLLLGAEVPRYEEYTRGNEVVISVLSGQCRSQVAGESPWEEVGGRASMLGGKPTMVYIPRNRGWSVRRISTTVNAAIFRAPARRDTAPALVRAGDIELVTYGTDTWERRAAMALVENVDADRLLAGETYNLPGRWSSYPPHKHDTAAPPREGAYEEIYHFAVEPEQGFGIQRVYTAPDDPDPLDEVYVVRDGDTVVIPRGYHPVVAGAGYRLGYLWALAGDDRAFGAWSDHPDHEWVRGLEPKN